jgi:hypothetical protein
MKALALVIVFAELYLRFLVIIIGRMYFRVGIDSDGKSACSNSRVLRKPTEPKK